MKTSPYAYILYTALRALMYRFITNNIIYLLLVFIFFDVQQALGKDSLAFLSSKTPQSENISLDNSNTSSNQYDDDEIYPNTPLTSNNMDLAKNHPKSKRTGNILSNSYVTKKTITNNTIDTEITIDTKPLAEKKTPAPEEQKAPYKPWIVKNKNNAIKKELKILPKSISKTQYNEINQSLPKAVYTRDYKILLFKEIERGNIDAVRSLLDIIQDIEVRDIHCNTPLIYAATHGSLDMIRFLITKKSNTKARNSKKHNAYEIALLNRRFDVANILYSLES